MYTPGQYKSAVSKYYTLRRMYTIAGVQPDNLTIAARCKCTLMNRPDVYFAGPAAAAECRRGTVLLQAGLPRCTQGRCQSAGER